MSDDKQAKTIQELEALPVGTVVIASDNPLRDEVYQRLSGGWVVAGWYGFQNVQSLKLPARILHSPKATS